MGTLLAAEELVLRLPLPLAQLHRRALNSKTALERHQAAYYLWEASLKLLASSALVEYATLGDHDPELREKLKNLARPSLGHWWELTRRLLPIIADANGSAEAARRARDLVLGRQRDDLPRSAGLDSLLREVLDSSSGSRSTVRLSELFDRLVRYRNRELGHGAAGHRPQDFYERMGRSLLHATEEVLALLDVLLGSSLIFVSTSAARPPARGSSSATSSGGRARGGSRASRCPTPGRTPSRTPLACTSSPPVGSAPSTRSSFAISRAASSSS